MTSHETLRDRLLRQSQDTAFDLAIIGGGITGAGILRDASLRGLRAILFEKNDFASGTSSHSSKLVHGGLRYLETFDLGLVFEGCHERQILLNTAPRIVYPLPFLYPVYRGQRRRLWEVGAGVFLYELLAAFRSVRTPRIRLRKRTLEMEPGLRSQDLVGSALYFDAITRDSDLTLATLKSGLEKGGVALNHTTVRNVVENGGTVHGVEVSDGLSGKHYRVKARWVVNASGPWVDSTRKLIDPESEPKLRPTKGVHLIFESNRFFHRRALLLLAPSDGRVTFVIPWAGRTMVGTTDTDFTGDPSEARATDEDVDYLLDSVNHYFPSAKLERKDIISTFAGIRPLLRDDRSHASQVSREHQIFSEKPGFVTIAGGKLTTYRKMAEQVVDWIAARTPEWKGKFGPSLTAKTHLDPAFTRDPGAGSQVEKEIEYHVGELLAATVTDVLCWRTSLTYLDRSHGLHLSAQVGEMLGRKLGLNSDETASQLREYLEVTRQAESGLRRDTP